jgi:hypothetical protein
MLKRLLSVWRSKAPRSHAQQARDYVSTPMWGRFAHRWIVTFNWAAGPVPDPRRC